MLFGVSLDGLKRSLRSVVDDAMNTWEQDSQNVMSMQKKIKALQDAKIAIEDELATVRRDMNNTVAKVRRDADDSAADNIREAKDTASELIRKAKAEKEDIKAEYERKMAELEFLAKQNEERLNIEADKREIAMMKRVQKEKMELQEKFYNDTLKLIQDNKDDVQGLYKEILARLPKVEALVENTNRQPAVKASIG